MIGPPHRIRWWEQIDAFETREEEEQQCMERKEEEPKGSSREKKNEVGGDEMCCRVSKHVGGSRHYWTRLG